MKIDNGMINKLYLLALAYGVLKKITKIIKNMSENEL